MVPAAVLSCQMREINSKSRGNALAKNAVSYHHAQFGLPEKEHAIKELVVRWVLLNLLPRLFGRKRRNCLPLVGLLDLTFYCLGLHPRPYEVIDDITRNKSLTRVYYIQYFLEYMYLYI